MIEPRFAPFPIELSVDDFRFCISKWANQNKMKGDPDGLFATFLYTIGYRINMEHGSWDMPWHRIADEMAKHRYRNFKVRLKPPSQSTIKRYTARAKGWGLLETAQTTWRQPDTGKVLPGANRIWINPNKVAIYGEMFEYDFFEPLRDQPATEACARTPCPSFEEITEPINEKFIASYPSLKCDPPMTHRGPIDDPTGDPSMNPITILDTGSTVTDTVRETVHDRAKPQASEQARRPPDTDRTANSSVKDVLRRWGTWNKVSTGTIHTDLEGRVGPKKLKSILAKYKNDVVQAGGWDFERYGHPDTELGLRKRLDKDLGTDLVPRHYKRQTQKEIQRIKEVLGTGTDDPQSDDYLPTHKQVEYEERLANRLG